MQFFQPPSSSHHHQFYSQMNSPDFPSGKSPRRELQGPRPAPLKVRKDSHKIKKPPIAPTTQHNLHQQPQNQHRPPVIIYTVSPKVHHTNPDDFMTLVQRLTGSTSSASENHGGVSPAARFASLEKTKSPKGKVVTQQIDEVNIIQGINMDTGMDMDTDTGISTGYFPGILSPAPNSLPYIPPNFFSPPSDQINNFGFFDLSPVLHTNRSYLDGSYTSPSSFLYSQITSPTQNLDLFNNFFDF